jgi:hypothetical protein
MVKKIRWDPEKSKRISDNPDRGISLEVIAEFMQSGSILDVIKRTHYPDQAAFIVQVNDDVWCVPFHEDEDSVFMITAWPDRKLKKRYSR